MLMEYDHVKGMLTLHGAQPCSATHIHLHDFNRS